MYDYDGLCDRIGQVACAPLVVGGLESAESEPGGCLAVETGGTATAGKIVSFSEAVFASRTVSDKAAKISKFTVEFEFCEQSMNILDSCLV
jgi:hypothetical protein